MKRVEVVEIRNALRTFAATPGPNKWQWNIAKNLRLAEAAVEGYPSAESLRAEFEKSRTELCTRHSRKDASGQPIMTVKPSKEDGQPERVFDIIDQAAFDTEFVKLRDDINAKLKDLQLYMLEEDPDAIKWHTMKLDTFPATIKDLDKILDLIEE